MKVRIAEIAIIEGRPFSYKDFINFEANGQKYKVKPGVIRNKLMEFKRKNLIKLAYNSGIAFYTIPGKEFNKSIRMTPNHMGVSTASAVIDDSLLKQTPIYRWLKNRPTEKQALHNIRLTFKAAGIWSVVSSLYPTRINSANKDIILPAKIFIDYLDIIVTIHHTDTVSVAVSCSFRPIVVELMDIIQLYEALIRTELYLVNLITNSKNENDDAHNVPSYREWVVKMWHFGVDTIDEFIGNEFEVTFFEGMSDLYRIYSKRMKGGKKKVRVEHQELPNQKAYDAFVTKLFPDGRLVASRDFDKTTLDK